MRIRVLRANSRIVLVGSICYYTISIFSYNLDVTTKE